MRKLRTLKPSKLKALREAKGLSWHDVEKASGINMYQYAKMERGTTRRALERNVRALARALDTRMDVISEAPEPSQIQAWADYHNLSPYYATHLAREGRIEGAYKDDSGKWSMDIEANKLPPTDASKKKWHERYESYGRDYQRRRRGTLRPDDGSGSGATDLEDQRAG